jgi:tripartite-type tricarboxylate transporter receptor subunit TctC
MRRVPIFRAALALSAALFLGALPASAASDFYKGKRLTMLINFAPGGPTDIEGRLVARFLTQYLDGNTGVIVQNMDGAGGVIGINYLGEIAPRDGTMIGFVTGAAFQHAIEPLSRKVDLKTYEFVAHQTGTNVYYLRTDVRPGMKTATDIVKAENVVAGGLSADSTKDLLMRLGLDLLGVKFNYVTGYKSNQNARMALQTGEVNMFSESPPGYRGIVEPSLVAKGEVIPVFHDPFYDGKKYFTSKQMEGLDIPTLPELYTKIYGKPPTGPLWDAYIAVVLLSNSMLRQIIMPPNSPPDAVNALREAMKRLNTDPAFAKEAMTAFGFVPEWSATADVNEVVRNNMELDPKIRQFIIDYMKNPRGKG